jgi:hypothetical protein
MSRQKFDEFMKFLLKGLNSSKFQIGNSLEIYNSQSFWNLNSFPKGNLFLFTLSSTVPSLEIYGAMEVPVSYFVILGQFDIWKFI